MKSAVVTIACLVIALAPIMLGAQGGSAQAEVLALESSWIEAELHHDHVALARLMSDQLVLTEPDGSVINKADEIAFTADSDAHFEILESHDMKVLVDGDVSVVTGAYHEKGTFHGKSFEHRGRFTDTWVRHDRGWQCMAGQFAVSVAE